MGGAVKGVNVTMRGQPQSRGAEFSGSLPEIGETPALPLRHLTFRRTAWFSAGILLRLGAKQLAVARHGQQRPTVPIHVVFEVVDLREPRAGRLVFRPGAI